MVTLPLSENSHTVNALQDESDEDKISCMGKFR